MRVVEAQAEKDTLSARPIGVSPAGNARGASRTIAPPLNTTRIVGVAAELGRVMAGMLSVESTVRRLIVSK